MSNVEYEKIYLNQSRAPGRMRIADSGLGWKGATIPGSTVKTAPFLLPADEISSVHWSRASRGWELRIDTKNQGSVMLDGFDQQDFNGLKNELQKNFNVQLEAKEHSLRGWNWGKIQLARNDLVFSVNNRPSFEIPYSEITNSNLTGKNEVSIELDMNNKSKDIEKTGDELVEAKFYLPGNVELEDYDIEADTNTEGAEGATEKAQGEEGDDDESSTKVAKTSTKTNASVFYEEIKEKADIGQVSGDAIVSFDEVLFLTPRGRYDIDMYESFLRLRGKTYDYKIQYKQIQRIFSIPKSDQIHHLIILQIDPPLRQGQTRHTFLTLQFDGQEEIEVELNIDDEEYEKKYKDKLNKTYSSNTFLVLGNIMKELTERRIVLPGSFVSKDSQICVSCSLKASEGHIYPLEKCLLFVTKPTVLIIYSEIQNVIFSRADGSASKTFDMQINLRSGGVSHSFGNIDKGEQTLLEEFLKNKGLKVRNDEREAQSMLSASMAMSDGDDSDVDMGSADDDDSPDEDFKEGAVSDDNDDDSDVAEEYDSDAGSDAGSDEELDDANSGTDSDAEDGPKKKKTKN
ncbi:unnamed protein product [[Candida] boidinii]|uniref:FACT complex subunit POB3 n=1 Tax=Candida boidinii TaxID=5477 RepID=A0A9W6SXE3_CANBO|nr:hypothetical protein B5S30_g243 [[Candida] boidinii]GME67944.1 unnamed protein product [[Candida] boidinii]